jgi:F-type H+-transporting ATPase subunit epsilon
MAQPFSFELVSPESHIMSGQVLQVVVPGTEGLFTVLANHAPFLSTIRPGILDVTTSDNAHRRIFVRGGFADANPSGLTVLAEQAVAVEDIDMADLDQSIQDAREDVSDAKDDQAKQAAEQHLQDLLQVRDALKLAA